MTRVWTITFSILLLLGAIESIASEKEELSLDPIFEKRLAITSVYKTRNHDTLRNIASLLYGHKTWWIKLRDGNHHLRSFDSDQELPSGMQLIYRAPKIDSEYIVQPNDWLIRIVQWKYGATSYWEEIYRKNAQRISRPNLIHPGDRLTLELDGTVRQASSGQVLVVGAKVAALPPLEKAPEMAPEAVKPLENMSSDDGAGARGGISALVFFCGFGLGLILFVLIPWLLWARHRRQMFQGINSVVNARSRAYAGINLDALAPKRKRFARKKLPKPAPKKKFVSLSYPHGFDKRAVNDYELDQSLIHRDQGELEKPSGYHSIVNALQKRAMKSKESR
jgi:hypothetical protein